MLQEQPQPTAWPCTYIPPVIIMTPSSSRGRYFMSSLIFSSGNGWMLKPSSLLFLLTSMRAEVLDLQHFSFGITYQTHDDDSSLMFWSCSPHLARYPAPQGLDNSPAAAAACPVLCPLPKCPLHLWLACVLGALQCHCPHHTPGSWGSSQGQNLQWWRGAACGGRVAKKVEHRIKNQLLF